jgi:hypothetical protein
VFTTYLFPFEVTSALLVIAVVGAVVLSRRPRTRPAPEALDEDKSERPDEGPKQLAGSEPGSGAQGVTSDEEARA